MNPIPRRWVHLTGVVLLTLLVTCGAAWAQIQGIGLPDMNLPDIKIEPVKDSELSPNLQIMMMMTALGLIPYFIVSCTAYIRVTITMSYLKSALGAQQALSNQVMMGVCLIFTAFIMYPVGQRINETAIQPYLSGQIKQSEFAVKGVAPMREWMFKQVRESDLRLFLQFDGYRQRPKPGQKAWPKSLEGIPFVVLYTSFILSEIKTGFMIGFMIYIPFLIIDMICAATMMSMGMFMISSSTIALPFKLLMWVRLDGWHVIMKGLVYSFNRPDWMGPLPKL